MRTKYESGPTQRRYLILDWKSTKKTKPHSNFSEIISTYHQPQEPDKVQPKVEYERMNQFIPWHYLFKIKSNINFK